MRVLIALAFAIATSACLFDGAVPAGAAIACRDDSECPAGQVCSALLGGQCAPAVAGDNVTPTAAVLVEPAAAAVGTRVEVRVQASEPLGADPIAHIDLGAIRRPLVLEAGRATAGDLDFVFVYEPLGDEPVGPRALVVDMVDRLGAAGQALGSLTLDFQAPRLAAPPTLLATMTNTEVAVSVAFVDDADVPVVTVAMTPVAGGEALALAADPQRPGTFARGLDGVIDGPWQVTVGAVDAVGNAMSSVEAGVVVVDRAAPQATTATVSPGAVRRGDLVRLTLQANEALADDADIGGLVQIAPALSADVIATVGAGNLREVVLRVADDAVDGDYAITFGPLRDGAGNAAGAVALGRLRVDGTPPRVVDVLVDGAPLNKEGQLEVTIILDEEVPTAPRVLLGATALTPAPRGPDDVGHIWTWRLAGDELAVEDLAEIVVEASDGLGNRAAAIRTGTLVDIDTIAPQVVATEPSTTGEAAQGENVSIFVVFSEPVVSPPTLAWDGPTLDFTPTSTTSGRAFRFAAPVLVGSPGGDVRLVGVDETRDLAGNPVVRELAPMVLALRPDRCLPGQHFGEPAVAGRAPCVDDDVCLTGHHFGGEVSTDPTIGRVCLPLGQCSSTHHDGGDGSCVVIGQCARNHRFGGAVDNGVAVCVADDTCSPGFHFGAPAGRGVPECVEDDRCSNDHHFGGAVLPHPIGRECLPESICSAPHFHNGGDGTCVLFDECSPGFHDDDGRRPAFPGNQELRDPVSGRGLAGMANCIEMDRCAFGFQIGEDRTACLETGTCTCVPDGECAPEHHPGQPLTFQRNQVSPTGAIVDRKVAICVSPLSACAVGFHDNDGRTEEVAGRLVDNDLRRLAKKEAECIPIDTCSAGFQIGQFIDPDGRVPDCTTDNSCTCVPLGSCAVGFHPGAPVPPGGVAVCVPDNVCLVGARDDGHGNCIGPDQPCARGFHDGGGDLCLPRGRCADGFVDDGTGSCRSVNAPCAAGYRDDGDGTCRPDTEPCAPGSHDDGSGFDLPGRCVADGKGCAEESLRDGGDGNCLVKGSCAPGFVLVDDVCVSALACPRDEHDGGDGASCVPTGTCLPGFTLVGSTCRPEKPVLRPGVFDNACDPETTGRVGSDGAPLRVAVDELHLATAAVLECRIDEPTSLHTQAFAPCDTAMSGIADRAPGLVRLEVRAVVDLKGRPVVSRSAMHTFTVHASLDGVACCASPVSDARWFAAAADLLAVDEAFSPLSTAQKPYIFADGGEARLDVVSLRHRFALSEDHGLLLVTRTAASSFAERELGQAGVCSGVRLRLGESTNNRCPNDDEWRLPVREGRDGFLTARFTCTESADGCRRFQYHLGDRVLFEREDCVDVRSPYQLVDVQTTPCEAWVVNAVGDGLCLTHDEAGVRIVDVVEGAGTDLGLRILNNRGRHRAFSRLNKEGL